MKILPTNKTQRDSTAGPWLMSITVSSYMFTVIMKFRHFVAKITQ